MQRQSVGRAPGFTLVEALLALVVVSILAVIAVPSYQSAIQKARRLDAIKALQSLHLAQEHFRANCSTYATSLGVPRACDTGNNIFRLDHAATSENDYYQIAIQSGANGAGFVATADPVGSSQASDPCGVFAIDQDGPLTDDESFAGERCWSL